jgi:hypothetical protein
MLLTNRPATPESYPIAHRSPPSTDEDPAPSVGTVTDHSSCFASYIEFHQSVAHLRIPRPERIYKDGDEVPVRPRGFHCETCKLSKSTYSRPTSPSPVSARKPKSLEVIHSDLSGKFSRPSFGGAWHWIRFICQATRYSWIRFLKKKSDAPQGFATSSTCSTLSLATKTTTQLLAWPSSSGQIITANISLLRQTFDVWVSCTTVPPYHHELNGVPKR